MLQLDWRRRHKDAGDAPVHPIEEHRGEHPESGSEIEPVHRLRDGEDPAEQSARRQQVRKNVDPSRRNAAPAAGNAEMAPASERIVGARVARLTERH